MADNKVNADEIRVPPTIRLLVGAAGALERIGVSLIDLDMEKFKAKAEQEAGLTAYSDPQFVHDIAALVNFARRNPQLSAVGGLTFRNDIIRRLRNNLRLTAARRRYPDLTTQPLEKPYIIVGLPRTGTTLLQRMMSQDPDSHGPALWELFNPVRINEATLEARARKSTDDYIKTVRDTSTGLWSIHPTYTTEADECYFLLPQSVGEPFIYTGMDYFDWFMGRSAVPDYALYRQYLQAMHYGEAKPRRWVLKSPVHTPKLTDLLTVFPDACVIYCHRSLSEVMASWISFTVISRKYAHKHVDSRQVAQDWLRLWSVSVQEAQKARDSRPPEQFFDLYYDDFIADPVAMIGDIYAHFGIRMSTDPRAKMSAWYANDKKQPRPKHDYNLEQFGLSAADLKRAFAGYLERYPVRVV